MKRYLNYALSYAILAMIGVCVLSGIYEMEWLYRGDHARKGTYTFVFTWNAGISDCGNFCRTVSAPRAENVPGLFVYL